MSQEVFFEEDKNTFKRRKPKETRPEKGFEAWVYDNSPLKYEETKLILVVITLLFFVGSVYYLFISVYDSGSSVRNQEYEFLDRVEKTNSR